MNKKTNTPLEHRYTTILTTILFVLLSWSTYGQETFIDTIKFQEIENYKLNIVDTVDGFHNQNISYEFDDPKVTIFTQNNVSYLFALKEKYWVLYQLKENDFLSKATCQQIDGKGSKELVLNWTSQVGQSGPYSGSANQANHLQIINVESSIVLFDEIVSYNQEAWAKTLIKGCVESDTEDCIAQSYWENENCTYQVNIDSAQLLIHDFNYELEQSQNGELVKETKSNAVCTEFKEGLYRLEGNRFYWVRYSNKEKEKN